MPSEWKKYRLNDITELIIDCPHSTPQWTDSGVIVLRNQNIRNGKLDLSSPSYTDESGYQNRIKRAVLKAGDLIFTREAPMGEVCQLPEGLRCCLGQRMVQIRADKTYLNPRYLLFALQSPYLRHQIEWNEGTGTTVSNIRIPNIRGFLVPLPPLSEQKAIAHILGSLDDKIELNRKMNETLEAMAQAMFKSWFVDFDPVIDNALAAGNEIPEELAERAEQRKAILKSSSPTGRRGDEGFPSEFIHTDKLGWIPKGWEISDIDSECDFLNGYAFKSKELLRSPEKAVPIFKMGNILRGGGFNYSGTKSFYPIEKVNDIKKYTLKKGDVLMAMTDMKSNMALLGHTALMSVNESFLLNQRVGKLTPKINSYINYPYLYIYTNLDNTIADQRKRANSGVQVNLSTAGIKAAKIILPNKRIHDEFDDNVIILFERKFKSEAEIRTLSKLRDTLLPKLLLGELRIKDAEKLVEGI